MQMDRPDQACGEGSGVLPCPCAPWPIRIFPCRVRIRPATSGRRPCRPGTLFPGLNLPFKAAIQAKTPMPNTALAELMALDFAVDELGLYLTTHPTDQEVLDLYWTYVQLANEGRQKYQKLYGPLLQTDRPADGSYAWLKDPWPWERGGSE